MRKNPGRNKNYSHDKIQTQLPQLDIHRPLVKKKVLLAAESGFIELPCPEGKVVV